MHSRLNVLLASHFHDEIVRHASIAVVLFFVGLVAMAAVSFSAWYQERSRRLLTGLFGLIAILGVGLGYEAGQARHNHLCHAHSSDACDNEDSGGHRDPHSHWLGRWASVDKSKTPEHRAFCERRWRESGDGATDEDRYPRGTMTYPDTEAGRAAWMADCMR